MLPFLQEMIAPLHDQLKNYCRIKGISINSFCLDAILTALNEHEDKKSPGEPGL